MFTPEMPPNTKNRVRVAILAVLALAALAAPLSADAAVRWVVKGRGFGHGVGYSQYGAFGFASEGRGYRGILRHYYRGTYIGTVKPRVVRVLLYIEPGDVTFRNAVAACGRKLRRDRWYEAHYNRGNVILRTLGHRRLKNCGPKLRAHGRKFMRIDAQGRYRGALEVVPTKSYPGSLNVINAVAVDRYVQGCIPNEVPASWPMAALKTQAVAARSYALSSGIDGNGFTLYDDTRSQVYEGYDSETARSNRAAARTRREVVRYRGRIAQTFYFSTSGGRTESVEYGFIGSSPVPYLKSVRDPYDHHSPLHKWRLVFSDATMQARLGGYVPGRLRRIRVVKRGVSPRIVRAKLIGSAGTSYIRGDTLQYALGLYDRWAYFDKVVTGTGSSDESEAPQPTEPVPAPLSGGTPARSGPAIVEGGAVPPG